MGFPWVNRIFGILVLVTSLFALILLRPDPIQSSPRRRGGELLDSSALKDIPYLFFCLGLFFVELGYWIPPFIVAPYAQLSLGTSADFAFYLLAYMNAGSLAGRILPAWIAQVRTIGPVWVLIVGCLSLGALILGWIGIRDVTGITIWGVSVGFMSGIAVALPNAIVPRLAPFGYDSAFIGTTIARASFVRDFGITSATSKEISSNITSAFQAGALGGALMCFFITEYVGRKWALIISNLVFLAGAIPMVAATNDLASMYAGRALTGWGCGVITATVPSYIAELSIPSIRGILTGLFEVTYQTGSLIGFWINYGINQNMNPNSSASWRLPMAVQLIPAGGLLIGGFFLHESPLWLYRKGREEEGAKVLVALRHLPEDHQYMREEVEMIRARLAEEAAVAKAYGNGFWAYIRGSLSELSRKGMWNRLLLVFAAFTLQNMSGAAAINYYSPTLFGSIGISDVALYTGIYGLVKAVASIIFYGALIDIWGRRRPTIISSLACSLCLWFVGAYVKVGNPAPIIAAGGELSSSTKSGGQAATAAIMIYSVFWSFGLNGIPWIVSAEIFPGALRNLTGTFAAFTQWLIQFIITKALPYIFSSLDYGVWFFFACWMLTATIWAFFFLPETKGVTIDQMDTLFGYEGDRQVHSQQAKADDRKSLDQNIREVDRVDEA
ncbi:Quinate permease [Colletotrichum sp. SAR 10_86]|nr:Quinate permease [Colletotrichum sp. SAR 10_75]KAI8228489.1 Quinate permease [Colletotrichum sp. SAR 10_86]KAI8255606.1 Quinate permease [Colletotrichum sp. SAR 10_77]